VKEKQVKPAEQCWKSTAQQHGSTSSSRSRCLRFVSRPCTYSGLWKKIFERFRR